METKKIILLVEDEEAIRELLCTALTAASFDVLPYPNCQSAECYLADTSLTPDLLLLDWMLPDESGIDFAQRIRRNSRWGDIPIIMLTAKAEERNKLKAFEESRVDDYITKPFSIRELIARIHALLRRNGQSVAAEIRFNNLLINTETKQVFSHENRLVLTPKLYQLLLFLVTHQNTVYSREQLLDRIALPGTFQEPRSVDQSITRLRRLLTPCDLAQHVQTIRGHGYRWQTDV